MSKFSESSENLRIRKFLRLERERDEGTRVHTNSHTQQSHAQSKYIYVLITQIASTQNYIKCSY